jgi:hypothetical protein
MASSSSRTWILLVALVVVVAAGGAMTYLGVRDDDPWKRTGADVAVTPDRASVLARDRASLHPSCHEHRIVIDQEPGRWEVTLEARRTNRFCQASACIGIGEDPPIVRDGCDTYERRIPGGVPDDVEVVPADD